ncbi:SRPBCC family protein [Nocardioidaceae bacterium]|nr:SRPBCC family protein [Nocardioidaceae bacterium]
MTTFSATNDSTAVVDASREEIWAILTDPEELPRLTPNLERIDADGDTWVWHMSRMPILGTSLAPSFTETMSFDEPSRIEFTHTPPEGSTERAGAEGVYDLQETDGGTELSISLTITVDLPLPKLSKGAVTRVMNRVISRMGDRFADNLLQRLEARRA